MHRQLPYCKTLAIADASPADRPERMREYLDHWYEANRCEPYYDSHARGNQFLGEWSWEAAAITVGLRIDDAPYRDHAFIRATWPIAAGRQDAKNHECTNDNDNARLSCQAPPAPH